MIPRYSNPEISAIWSDQNRYKIWLDIERFALEGMVNEGLAPKEALDAFNKKCGFSVERIEQIEREVKHDVIAFLTNLAENIGSYSRYVHRGMTSSDVVDTCLASQIKQSSELLFVGLERLLVALKGRILEFKHTPCIGRTHGIHAEPTTFGLKLATWYTELIRHRHRLEQAIKSVTVGKMSGAVGTYAGISPKVEQHVMDRLGLGIEPVATQVVSRDRHAEFISSLAAIASSIERFCVEIRHLQRTEVREVLEGFARGQKGSSAMPHKRNPILSENLCGLARLMRSYSQAALEDIVLWHERDISHSSVERVIVPDACILMDFIFSRFEQIVKNLVVFPERMLENLELTRGTVFSGHVLLALVDKGMSREEAYANVQKHALAAWDGGATFEERIKLDPAIVSLLGSEGISKVFNLSLHLKHVDLILSRIFN